MKQERVMEGESPLPIRQHYLLALLADELDPLLVGEVPAGSVL